MRSFRETELFSQSVADGRLWILYVGVWVKYYENRLDLTKGPISGYEIELSENIFVSFEHTSL